MLTIMFALRHLPAPRPTDELNDYGTSHVPAITTPELVPALSST